MIFVTVGTHEQQFNRLIQKVEGLIKIGLIAEEVFIQRGAESTVPKNCRSSEMLSYQDMVDKVKKARIVITHGGPGSIMMSLSFRKVPIVVPRQVKYREHVDDHQVDFTRRLEAQHKVIAVYEIESLGRTISDYERLCREIHHFGSSHSSLQLLINKLDNYCRGI